jgi:hypothetical protein
MAKVAATVPIKMRRVSQRFERWRSSHQGRLPIPAALWGAAVELAREYGVCRTAQVLRLEYGKLKRLLAASGPVGKAVKALPSFVEVMAPPAAAADFSECTVELEGPRGKMRIQWKGTTAPDLAGLSRALWEGA